MDGQEGVVGHSSGPVIEPTMTTGIPVSALCY